MAVKSLRPSQRPDLVHHFPGRNPAVTGLLATSAPALASPSEVAQPDRKDQASGRFELPPAAIEQQLRDEVFPGWRSSQDVAWTTTGDSSGLHILTASADSGYEWSTIATLQEAGFEADLWIGNACLTGSGRRIVVTYAPRAFTNSPDLFDRGAFTAIVDLTSGDVTKLKVKSSLAYFNPGCGAGEDVIVSQFSGDDAGTEPARSRMFKLDAANGTLAEPIIVDGQITSAVPTTHGLAAAAAGQLVRVGANGRTTSLAKTSGVPFHMTPDAHGGVVYLERHGDQVQVRRSGVAGRARSTHLATGELGKVGLARGAAGRVFLTGQLSELRSLPPSISRADVPRHAQLSSEGKLALTRVERIARNGAEGIVAPTVSEPLIIEASVVDSDAPVEFGVADVAGMRAAEPSETEQPSIQALGTTASSTSEPFDDERWCSVPRNDPQNQVLQPKPRQVEWAINQAVTNSLYVQRPWNWKNLGMPAYKPQELFPPLNLVGGGRVPSQVMLGIAAQESNMWQASPHALPGVTANPLIGNFYGRNIYNSYSGDDWDIHWNDADCGYGVMQVTDGMRRAGHEKPGETALPYNQQRAIALDFAANVAAGLRILQDKWNQTQSAGLTVTTDGPYALENWFFALWAYNTGFYPDKGDGSPWGVGWANNPVNPRYPADRDPFMEFTYSDASHPQDWPYQEKVIGFAGHPPTLLEGPDQTVAGFRASWWLSEFDREAAKPPIFWFCREENDCYNGESFLPDHPSVIGEPAGPCAHQTNGMYDLKCWWHTPTAWKNNGQYGREVLRFDPGYAYQEDATTYPPNCTLDGLPSGVKIIDNVRDGVRSVRPNCSQPASNAGQFSLDFAQDSRGDYSSKIDFHQVGGGYGGHFWFARIRGPEHELYDRTKVTGTWEYNFSHSGWARVLVHVPNFHAHTQQAEYEIDLGSGFENGKRRVVLQNTRANKWISLGAFEFSGTPRIRLTNQMKAGYQAGIGSNEVDIAWDAVAIQLLPAKPAHQIVALGDSYSSGEGSVDHHSEYYEETDWPTPQQNRLSGHKCGSS